MDNDSYEWLYELLYKWLCWIAKSSAFTVDLPIRHSVS